MTPFQMFFQQTILHELSEMIERECVYVALDTAKTVEDAPRKLLGAAIPRTPIQRAQSRCDAQRA